MDIRLVMTLLGVAGLAIVAVIDGSPVMFVSAATIGIIVYVFRNTRLRDRVIAVFAAGLAGGIGAEIAHTLYRHLGAAGSSATGEGGRLFMSAIMLGLINAGVVVAIIFLTGVWLRISGRMSG